MTAIYTKNGDDGKTLIIGKDRQSKSKQVFEVLGVLDELNSAFGVILSEKGFSDEARNYLERVQSNLFEIGALLGNAKTKIDEFDWLERETADLEYRIDEMDAELPELRNFILPGGSKTSSKIHMARAICRRLERRTVAYFNETDAEDSNSVIMYINRLSDFLFTLARFINLKLGYEEKIWKN